MAGSILKLAEIKLALNKKELNFKIIQNPESKEDSVIFIDECSKVKLCGKIIRSFNEGEVHHWPLLNHENVARLIDILCIRDDIYIYLTIHHEVTLKNIVHDENFVYDAGCFDRKRLYAKGIFTGISYLHGKSLTLMNLCDDNIVISTTDDRAIITNFDHLTIARKTTKSRLNVPEMYKAPETDNGEFDASKAEIWASGVLMLDMFLAHMIPWAFVNFKPQKVIQIVHMVSLDLLQAANAGSIVTAADLEKLKTFLKCFFKQNPQERIPAKYASIASFLQNRDRYKVLKDSYQSTPLPEYILPENCSNLSLLEEDTTFCSNSTCDSSSYSISPSVQNAELFSATNNSYILTDKAEQIKRSVQLGENKMEVDKPLSRTSNISINVEKEVNISPPSSNKSVVFTADTELNGDFQKMSKSWDSFKEEDKSSTKSSYNCYQANSLSFIKPERSSKNATSLQIHSKRSCYSNTKPSIKQPVECDLQSRDFDLNFLFNNSDANEIEKNSNINTHSNSAVEFDLLNAITGKNFPEIFNPRHIQSGTQIVQHVPSTQTPLQTSEKHTAKPIRNSEAPPLFLTPEIIAIASRIIHLRKYYYSIRNRYKEFESAQKKLIGWQNLILKEDFLLLEMLRKKYELKFEDISKLIEYVNETVPFSGVHRNSSYYRAVKSGDNDQDGKWEINDQLNKRNNSKEEWERANFVPDYEMKPGYVIAAAESDKMTIEGDADLERIELAKQPEQWRRCVKMADEMSSIRGVCPLQGEHGEIERVEMIKKHEQSEIEQMEINLNAVGDVNCNSSAHPEKEKNKESKKKKKGQKINTKEKVEKDRKETEKKEKKKLDKSKQSVDEKADKKEKKQRDLKKHEEYKRPRFFSMCAGRGVEEPIPITDTLYETYI